MGSRAMRAAVSVTIVALVSGSSAVLGPAALAASTPGSAAPTAAEGIAASPVDELVPPVPIDSPTGSYVVLLDEAPAASYDGGAAGLPGTTPRPGETFDPHSRPVTRYVDHLRDRQRELADAAGIEPLATYQTVLNGFSARMTPDAAARLAATDGVRAVHPDEVFHPDPALSREVLELGAQGGAEQGVSGAEETPTAGAGVVIGVIDTGIAPDNPAFAGERLRAARGDGPYRSGDSVVFDKADGTQFRSARATFESWDPTDYSTKLIGAQYFSLGAESAGFSFEHDTLSPADGDGHGSQAASVAAGDPGTAARLGAAAVAGAAPAAKIASYKACFAGHDPVVTSDDVCVGSDLLAALDRAVADGVDVIGYGVAGGASASGWVPDDLALYNAAVAGVFVAVGAGGAGPGPSTVLGGAPWYATVAAATTGGFDGTVELSSGLAAPGVSVSVPAGAAVTAPVVYAGDVALEGSPDADLCYLGTLDPALVEGAIVVCDRGTNPRLEKSQEVREAGGVGMILANVTPDSLEADVHSLPTVHVDADVRDELLAAIATEPGLTATLTGENLLEDGIPAPQIAPFSGRGPLSPPADVLAPDLAAPGVGILAASADAADGEPRWEVVSGTSVAASHVAGLAALYLSVHPAASPDEIASALMTTAAPTLLADGSMSSDAFAQGAGHVDPSRASDPGLLYLSGPDQWSAHSPPLGIGVDDGSGIGGDEVNLPSITVSSLAQEVAVTRTLTATRPGTYRAVADIPGVEVTVSPESLTFAGAGQAQEFTVTFRADRAPVEVWATGQLTWLGDDGTSVRSPLAVLPVSADAAALVTGDGTAGRTDVSIVPGLTGRLPLGVAGLAPVELLVDPDEPAPGHSGDAGSGDENGDNAWVVDVPEGSALARFALEASDDSDLGLTAYRIAGADDTRYYERWALPRGPQSELTLDDPVAGSYLVVAHVAGAAEGSTWDLTAAVVPSGAGGSLEVEPASMATVAGQEMRYTLAWQGLEDNTRYLGVVRYGESDVRTIVEVDAGAVPPAPDGAPELTGAGEVGELLTVDPGGWTPEDVVFSFRWLRDGTRIPGATSREYRVREGDVGSRISAEVSATERGNVNPGVATSADVVIDTASRVEIVVSPYRGTAADQYSVTVEVTTSLGAPATGPVTVSVDAASYTGVLADGEVTFALPAQPPGIHVVVGEYGGDEGIDGSTGLSGFVVFD